MKKLFTIACMSFSLALSAQTSLSTAADFTVTTTGGQTFNLYDKLNEGKYVLLDFFFTTCPPCIATAPYYKASFENYGCNTQDVFFISLDYGDTDAQVEAFEATYFAGYNIPAASGIEGNANAVSAAYGIPGYPTYVLVAPNKDILEPDMWPISSAATFTDYLTTQNGIAQKSCAATGVDEMASVHISLYPNPVIDRVNITSLQEIHVNAVSIMNMFGQTVLSQNISATDVLSFDISGLAAGMYVMNITTDKGVKQETFIKQ